MPGFDFISVPLAVGFDNPYLIQQSLLQLLSPLGFGLAIVLALLLFGLLAFRNFFWVAVCLLLVASSITSHLSAEYTTPYHAPVQAMAEQGRNVTMGLLLMLLVPSLLISKGLRNHVVHPGMIAYLLFELLYAFEFAVSRTQGSLLRLIITLLLYTLMFAVIGFGMSKMLQDTRDATNAIRAIAWAGVIITAITAFELLTNQKSVVINKRLASITATATFAAEMFTAVMLPTLYLAMRPNAGSLGRLFWIFAFACEGLMLIATGTRTGLVMLAIGLVIMLRSRLAKLFPMAIGLTVLITLLLLILPEDLGILGAARMLDLSNTRAGAWQMGIEAFLTSPFFGVSINGDTVLVENSYIAAVATSGVIGVIPFLVALMLFVRSLFQMQVRRSTLQGDNQFLVDLVIGAFLAELVGALFDAYLLAAVSFQLYVMMILASLMYFVLDRLGPAQQQLPNVTISSPVLSYDPAYAV